MKKLIAMVLLATSCATASNVGKVAYDCAAPKAAQVESQIEQDVLTMLASQDYENQLLGLAASLGADGLAVVTCVVEHYLSGLTPPASPGAVAPEVIHAHNWMSKYGQ